MALPGRLLTYALNGNADFMGDDIHYASNHDFVGIEFSIHGMLDGRVRVGMPGKFNADNALAALAVCTLALSGGSGVLDDHTKQAILGSLVKVRVDGRMEIAHVSKKCSVIVDYAHNAVSMESLLTTLRDYHPKRLVCVFGCGGNRARDRRYSMGEIGGKMADLCIITADNPRFEKNESRTIEWEKRGHHQGHRGGPCEDGRNISCDPGQTGSNLLRDQERRGG